MSTYKIDAAHSDITFKVKHMMITNVSGSFTKFDATMESEAADFSDAKISFEADVDSISTNNEQRDGHLKSDDFFAAEKFPKLSFTSSSLVKKGDDYVEELKDKFNDFLETLTNKVESAKDDADDLIEKGKSKVHDLKKEVKYAVNEKQDH